MKRFLIVLFMCCLIIQNSFSNEEKKSGGAFLIMPQFLHLNLSPVKDLVVKEPDMNNYPFNLGNNMFMLHGIGAYWGKKSGTRVGFGLWGGYKKYTSDSYSGVLHDSLGVPMQDTLGNILKQDSIIDLWVIPAYIGFLMEQSFSLGPLNMYGGCILGSGVIVLVKDQQAKEEQSAFYSSSNDNYDNMDDRWNSENSEIGAAVSLLWVLDLHLGLTYSMTNWFHVGGEGSIIMLNSSDGFGVRSETFNSVNPGFKIRLIFGNLG